MKNSPNHHLLKGCLVAESYFYAVLLGLALGFVYDVFRLFRLTINDKFFFDFIFWMLTSIVAFCYLLIFNNGSIRAIYIVLIFIGFVLYIFTLGYVTKPLEMKIAKKMKFCRKKVKKVLKSFKKVLQSIYNIYYNITERMKKIFKFKGKGDNNGSENDIEEVI